MQSEANLDQLSSTENGLGALEINGKDEKSILESQRAVTGDYHPLCSRTFSNAFKLYFPASLYQSLVPQQVLPEYVHCKA